MKSEPLREPVEPSETLPEPSFGPVEEPVRAPPAKPKKRARGNPGPTGSPFGSTGFKPLKKSVTLPVYPASQVDLSIPIDQRKKIDELTSETCRWPVGTPGSKGFFFCGGQTVVGDVYCKTHAKRAYSGHTLARIGVGK
jgi:GcrA cell cycle regulator